MSHRSKTRFGRLELLETRRLLAADLAVSIESVSTEAIAAAEFSYQVRVRNDGPDDATEVSIDLGTSDLESPAWQKRGPFPFPSVIDPTMFNGRNGFQLDSVRGAQPLGDINGDNIADLIAFVGYEPTNSYYVIFGDSSLGASEFHVEDLDGSNGFEILDMPPSIRNVTIAGDVNGDEIVDLLIGPYVLLGGRNVGSDGSVSVHADGFLATTHSTCELCSGADRLRHVPAGDVNGDGIDDILFTDQFGPRTLEGNRYDQADIGEAWLVFGRPEIDTYDVELTDSTKAIHIHVDSENEIQFGTYREAVGDVNGDGFDDIFFGDSPCCGPRAPKPTGYLVYGASDLASSGELIIQPGQAQEGIVQFVLGENTKVPPVITRLIPTAADYNGDGFNDLAFGTTVLYGRPGRITTGLVEEGKVVLEPSIITPDIGFERPYAGRPALTGDVNGDGELDSIVFDEHDTVLDDGVEGNHAIYVVFSEQLDDGQLPSASQLNGKTGFAMFGLGPEAAISAGPGVDYNADGISDFMVGIGGAAYMMFGTELFNTTNIGSPHDVVDIPAGGEVVYTVRSTIPFAAQKQSRSFSSTATSAEQDANISNNTSQVVVDIAAATLAPEVAVAVRLSNDRETIFPGDELNYLLTVTNESQSYVTGAQLKVELHANLLSPTWWRTDERDSGEGDIDAVINMPPMASFTYEIAATAGRLVGDFASTTTIHMTPGQTNLSKAGTAVDRDASPQRLQVPELIGNVKPCFNDTVVHEGELFFAGLLWDLCFNTRTQGGFWGGTLWKRMAHQKERER